MRFIFTMLFLSLLPPAFAGTPVTAKHGMVASEQRLASAAGIEMLKAGGNAIDAAVAVGYALAVVNPCCGNLGGGGFMTIRLANGENIFINFREKAPLKATKNMFLDANGNVIDGKSTNGYLAVAVPGTVLGLETALKKYGTMTRKQVMAPAIRLAQQGYDITAFDAELSTNFATDFHQQPNVAAIFLNHGQPYQIGQRFIQKDLANTLQLISDKGSDAFYHGSIARKIVKASTDNNGILSLEDFARYNVEILKPVQCTYHNYSIISAPPPSSGGVTLCEMLNILENLPLKKSGYQSAQDTHYIIEAMRYGFADRNTLLGDPDFVTNPVTRLISKKYAAEISKKIFSTRHAPLANPVTPRHELTDTTHYSVVDSKGNAVAVTYTINGFFGARVIADHTGFFLNDEMDDFTAKSGSPNKFNLVMNDTNDIQPGKRPLSSMTPTIVLKNGRLFMVVGSPGGPRIITAVLLTLLNVIDYQLNLKDAVDAPRLHFQGVPDTVDIESEALTPLTIKKLDAMGYKINPQHSWAAVEAIVIDPDNKTLYGANDKRRPAGAAEGY